MGAKSRTCPVDKNCSQWAIKYMGYCLCSRRDGFSLGLGLISVVAWGVAEVPQIITNYKTKSADGLSILFLLTWIIGDFFNLIGCMLEPATLPTQYYTAVLYLVTTVLLFGQTVYYGHIYPRLKSNRRLQEAIGSVEWKEHNKDVNAEEVSTIDRWRATLSSPIPIPSSSPLNNEELYFLSARSLAVTQKPTPGSYPSSRTPPTSDIERLKEPLVSDDKSTKSAPLPKIKSTLCVVSLMFILGICNEPHEGRREENIRGKVFKVGRELLQATGGATHVSSTAKVTGIGTCLGWAMTAIYLCGRLPQICLNIRRGNAEGLNPLMFVFALVGNGSYVASILVNSLDWMRIKPNLPWLVESGGCVCLDCFILLQFIYFRYRPISNIEKFVS